MAKRNFIDMETAAALAWEMGVSPELWRPAYNAAASSMGGFPGFYYASVEMAMTLEEYAKAENIAWGEDADWILTVQAIAHDLLRFMTKNERLPRKDERVKIVKKNISR